MCCRPLIADLPSDVNVTVTETAYTSALQLATYAGRAGTLARSPLRGGRPQKASYHRGARERIQRREEGAGSWYRPSSGQLRRDRLGLLPPHAGCTHDPACGRGPRARFATRDMAPALRSDRPEKGIAVSAEWPRLEVLEQQTEAPKRTPQTPPGRLCPPAKRSQAQAADVTAQRAGRQARSNGPPA